MTLLWLKKKGEWENKRETESLFIETQNYAKKPNYAKAKIDNTQKSKLHGERDETVNNSISKYRKLAWKEYKARHDWVGKVQQIKILTCRQMLHAQTKICHRK